PGAVSAAIDAPQDPTQPDASNDGDAAQLQGGAAADAALMTPTSESLGSDGGEKKKNVGFVAPSATTSSPATAPKSLPVASKRFEVLAQRRRTGAGLTPAQQKQLVRLQGATKNIKLISQRTLMLMKHLQQRERFWVDFCNAFIDVVDEELQARKAICAVQETEQRAMIIARHDLATRRALTYMHEYFSHFITWAEHGTIIELMEGEERDKGEIWERSDMRRIAVREEYTHRAALWNVQLQTATSHLLTRIEFLNRTVMSGIQDLQRRRLVLEARTATVRQWENEERRVRLRWHIGAESFARREIYGREETAARRRMEQREVADRTRLVAFMHFIGLEFGLRGVEYWENAARTAIELP
ncbi:MAG: hypothetical protein Q8J97_11685, partial [Flavobacteriaceae bacterium]|nr:hypothetical protein [Flavobacteriaceae bacterium]